MFLFLWLAERSPAKKHRRNSMSGSSRVLLDLIYLWNSVFQSREWRRHLHLSQHRRCRRFGSHLVVIPPYPCRRRDSPDSASTSMTHFIGPIVDFAVQVHSSRPLDSRPNIMGKRLPDRRRLPRALANLHQSGFLQCQQHSQINRNDPDQPE